MSDKRETPRRVKIPGGELCLVMNEATFSGIKHYGIMFTMLPEYQHDKVTQSIGWIPATLCELAN